MLAAGTALGSASLAKTIMAKVYGELSLPPALGQEFGLLGKDCHPQFTGERLRFTSPKSKPGSGRVGISSVLRPPNIALCPLERGMSTGWLPPLTTRPCVGKTAPYLPGQIQIGLNRPGGKGIPIQRVSAGQGRAGAKGTEVR